MRTTLDLNDTLVNEAMRLSGAASKTAVINEALNMLVKYEKRKRLIEMAGTATLEIDLDATRKRG